MKTAMVDVDNVLHQFDKPLYERLVRKFPNLPPPSKWNKWSIFDDYMSDKIFYKEVDYLHERQHEMEPFKEAKNLLDFIHKKGYFITISSNRKKKYFDSLKKFLDNNNLRYDDIKLSDDKTKDMSNTKVNLIIDDSPKVLDKAKQLGYFAVGLEYPYNKDKGYLLFKDITNMIIYLRQAL
jgi:HAD superfamily hydrolase (TIGR01509 family)